MFSSSIQKTFPEGINNFTCICSGKMFLNRKIKYYYYLFYFFIHFATLYKGEFEEFIKSNSIEYIFEDISLLS